MESMTDRGQARISGRNEEKFSQEFLLHDPETMETRQAATYNNSVPLRVHLNGYYTHHHA
jgi:hypothetical protein